MRKIILAVFILTTFYSLLSGSEARAQLKFSETKSDSVTAASAFTWKVLPKGTVAIEVAPDSSDVVYIAFTGPGTRGAQRKDSVNTRRIYKGQSRFFYNLDRDSIGFKGSGKVYYWIDRGEGAPGTLIQAQGAASAFNPAADNNFSVMQSFNGIKNSGAVINRFDTSYKNGDTIGLNVYVVAIPGNYQTVYLTAGTVVAGLTYQFINNGDNTGNIFTVSGNGRTINGEPAIQISVGTTRGIIFDGTNWLYLTN